MNLKQLERLARNIPTLPRWDDTDVEQAFLEFSAKAQISEIYDALEILRKHRIFIYNRFVRYVFRRYAASPAQVMQFHRFLLDAKKRAITSLE